MNDKLAGLDNNEKSSKSFFEYWLYFKQIFIGVIGVMDKPEFIANLKKRIAICGTVLGLSKYRTMQVTFLSGLDLLETKIKAGEYRKLSDLSEDEFKKWQIAQEINRIHIENMDFHELQIIYKERGRDYLIEFCEKYNIDCQNFLKRISWPNEKIKGSDRDKDWLFDYFSDKGEVEVPIVKKDALSDGIIHNLDRDWRRLAKTAERTGYTDGRHGFWKLPD